MEKKFPPSPDPDEITHHRAYVTERVEELYLDQLAAAKARTAVQGVVDKLTLKQRKFLIEYILNNGNATKAAAAVGYSNPHSAGPRLAKNHKILDALKNYFQSEEMGSEEVVARLSLQAKAPHTNYIEVDEDGRISVNIQRLIEDGLGHLIKKVTYVRTGSDDAEQVVEFQDSFEALIAIGKYHKLFTDKIDLTSKGKQIKPITIIKENRPE